MNTDDFTTAARAEAERRTRPPGISGQTLPSMEQFAERDGYRRGFTDAAEWARAHLAAQEPTDGERAVRALHRPAQVYTLAEDCADPESHEWSTASHGGDELCLSEPTGQQFCTECCPEDAFDCTDYPYPCGTIQALDSARATHCPEEGRA